MWLTVEGFDLVKITEEVLLESLDIGSARPARPAPAVCRQRARITRGDLRGAGNELNIHARSV